MRKPTSLKVFGQRVAIKYVRYIKDAHGDYDYHTKQIRLEESLKGKLFVETLIHEAIHAVFDRVGLNQAIDHNLEEIVCDNVAKMIEENFVLEIKKRPRSNT